MNMTGGEFPATPPRSIRISLKGRQALDCGDSSPLSRRSSLSRSKGRVGLPSPTGLPSVGSAKEGMVPGSMPFLKE